ncbi:hypothetical protein NM688_g2885 [Phlebia brevispora]|uniref:Uncharacterized protein n=1 Tax=Phlebia brevispora TaxID=194682 RepID=A0ACC1T7I1_9APHY|nr:hypothetical protein NM688_g2885 [Phlebia brevispora]
MPSAPLRVSADLVLVINARSPVITPHLAHFSMSSTPPSTVFVPSSISGLNLNTTVGALLMGGLISAVLYGITSTQTMVYHQRAHSDHLHIKLAVYALWVLDTFDMCLIVHVLYWYLVTHYGNNSALQTIVWSMVIHVLITSLTQTVVRFMFILRIYSMSQGNKMVTAIIAVASLVDLGTHASLPEDENTICPLTNAEHSLRHGDRDKSALVYAEFAAGFVGDAVAAGYLCYLLHKSRTGIKGIINYVSGTQLPLAGRADHCNYLSSHPVCLSLSLNGRPHLFAFHVQLTVRPNDFIYIALYFQLSKLYVNAYLAMLNARESLRETMRHVSFNLTHGLSTLAVNAPADGRPMHTYPHPESKMEMAVDSGMDAGTLMGLGRHQYSKDTVIP